MLNPDELNTLFKETLGKLERGERPLYTLTSEEIAFSIGHLNELNSKQAPEESFMPILCVLDHSKRGSLDFVEPICKVLSERNESQLLIYTLNAALKVIIEECERQGERIPFAFMKALPPLLKHQDPEVVEWTLRTIESLGHQSIMLKEDVLKARPGITALFNKHKKNSQDLVDFLIKRWSPQGRI
jgi:hypothetical protein